MPELSIVIPYFNKPKSIQKCLKGIYESSFKDLEVIVVFDGEDKEGEKLVEKFEKKGVKKLVIEHGGAPKARNAGAALATGKYISFLDADIYLESGAIEVWIKVFNKYPDIDFVYSGYKFYPEGMGAVDGQPFDPWLLQINNYISGVFPIKREKAPKWDESLKSLQDWDFWLTAVENGCKGYYVRGYGFKTDFPTKDSISGKGCTPENWLDRLDTVKKKHNIPMRNICVTALLDREFGISLAKMIDADYRDMPTYFPNKYDTIIQVGFSPRMADVFAQNLRNQWNKSKNILFWRGVDVYSLRAEASRDSADALAVLLNANVDTQLCEDIQTKRKLEGMGFKVSVLPLPLDYSKDEVKPLGEFKVLYDVHEQYHEVFDYIKRSMPDVPSDELNGFKEASDYTVLVRFQPDRSVDTNLKKCLLNGRYVVSNVAAPYCGLVDIDKSMEEAKTNITKSIRSIQRIKEINSKAIEFYKDICSKDKFTSALTILTSKELSHA